MQPLQVAEARASLSIEPHLLAQEANEDQPHPDRSRDAGQVPADGIPVRVEQERKGAEHPNEGGKEEEALGSGGLRAGEFPPPATERPDADEAVSDTAGPDRERRHAARAHD